MAIHLIYSDIPDCKVETAFRILRYKGVLFTDMTFAVLAESKRNKFVVMNRSNSPTDIAIEKCVQIAKNKYISCVYTFLQETANIHTEELIYALIDAGVANYVCRDVRQWLIRHGVVFTADLRKRIVDSKRTGLDVLLTLLSDKALVEK